MTGFAVNSAPDMTALTHLDEPNMLKCLQARQCSFPLARARTHTRLQHLTCLTRSGTVKIRSTRTSQRFWSLSTLTRSLYASRWCRWVLTGLQGIYTDTEMRRYRGQKRPDMLAPHIFAVAEKAYQELTLRMENQSMICCGESGSGKTEST